MEMIGEAMEFYNHKSREQYRKAQIVRFHAKEERLWMQPATADEIARMARLHFGDQGAALCHGARNGRELHLLGDRLPGWTIIGTDIAPDCTKYPGMIHHDFHEPRPEWEGRMDIVYTNALDHALQPDRAVATWIQQLHPFGCLLVEWTPSHAGHTNNADCFAATLDEYWQLLDVFGEASCLRIGKRPIWLFKITARKGDTCSASTS